MVGNSSSTGTSHSDVVATKKRKSDDEIPELPFPKHVCSDQRPKNCNSLPESCTVVESQDSNDTSTTSTFNEPDTCHNSVEPSTSSESRSFTNSGSTEMETESTSISDQPRSSYHQCAHSDSCNCSEYDDAKQEKELNDLLGINGADSKDFVLSSGRWSVNQDGRGREGGEKLTIDKEFENHFSMLML